MKDPQPGARFPLTEERRKTFLEVLRATGSYRAAAAAASPHARGAKHGFESFRNEIARSPEFALQVEEARNAALGKMEEIVAQLASGKISKPIYRNSGLVGTEPIYDVQCLLRLLERLDAAWRPASKTEVTGRVEHVGINVALTLHPQDILLLDEPDRATITELILEIGKRKARAALPPPESEDHGYPRP